MSREEAKDLALSILVVVAVLLAADGVWLHCKCAAQRDELAAQAATISVLSERLESHVNPPTGPTVKDRTMKAYDKAKDAVKRGYDKVKESFPKKEEPAPVK